MAIVLRHAVISCRPLSKMADNVDKTDKKTSIDQGLKLLREATDLLSGSLSDNIPLVDSTSTPNGPNANRSDRIASNLRALFSAYDDALVVLDVPLHKVEIKLQVRQKRKEDMRFFQASGNMDT